MAGLALITDWRGPESDSGSGLFMAPSTCSNRWFSGRAFADVLHLLGYRCSLAGQAGYARSSCSIGRWSLNPTISRPTFDRGSFSMSSAEPG